MIAVKMKGVGPSFPTQANHASKQVTTTTNRGVLSTE
jgi:hypothetical protein